MVNLNAFQIQTIRQPDGTEIQVLKQPGSLGPGTLVKQITKGPVVAGAKPPLTIATTSKQPLPVMLPKSPVSLDAIKAGAAAGGVKLNLSSGPPPIRAPPPAGGAGNAPLAISQIKSPVPISQVRSNNGK